MECDLIFYLIFRMRSRAYFYAVPSDVPNGSAREAVLF